MNILRLDVICFPKLDVFAGVRVDYVDNVDRFTSFPFSFVEGIDDLVFEVFEVFDDAVSCWVFVQSVLLEEKE